MRQRSKIDTFNEQDIRNFKNPTHRELRRIRLPARHKTSLSFIPHALNHLTPTNGRFRSPPLHPVPRSSTHMTPRTVRRAAERKTKKQAHKAALLAGKATPEPIETLEASGLESTNESHKPATVDQPDFSSITPAQLAANRANAQLSTGPRSPAGLAKSSKNAVTSALTGRTVLLPTDDVEEYARFLAGFARDLKPVGPTECELVQIVVDSFWRQRRIQALEFALYAHGHEQFEEAFQDCPEQDRYTKTLLQTHMTYEKQFRNHQIQEARLDRKRSKAMAELQRLQTERNSVNDESDVEDFSDLEAEMERVLAQSATSTRLNENGFDFSNDRIMERHCAYMRSLAATEAEETA